MGSVYYQENKNLDSLSDVSGFSSALNGKTYGLKKIGGRFYPGDVNSGGSISGIIPSSGLFLDNSNRVGVLANSSSGLITNSNGLSVLLDNNGGLQKNNNGVGIKVGDNSVIVDSSGLKVRVASGSSIGKDSTGYLFLKTGNGLDISSNDGSVSVKVDNNTITFDSNGSIRANTPSAPVLPSFRYIEDKMVNTVNMSTTNLTSCNTRITSIPAKYGLLVSTNFEITFEVDATVDYDTCKIVINWLGATTEGIGVVDYLVDNWTFKQFGGVTSGTFKKKLSYTSFIQNNNTYTVDITLMLGCSTTFGSTDGFPLSLTATNFKTQVVYFPISP